MIKFFKDSFSEIKDICIPLYKILIPFIFIIKILEEIGIVKIIKPAFTDPTDKEKKFVAVQVAYYKDLIEPVSLADIKENKAISHLPLIKQSRLSVMPIDSKSWKIISKMGRI